MKKILLYSLGATVLTMVVSALFVFGVFNTSLGTANLIGAEVGLLHGSGEIELHNRIVRDIHDIGNKTKKITAMLETAVNEEGSETAEPADEITDEIINNIEYLNHEGSEAENNIGAITDETANQNSLQTAKIYSEITDEATIKALAAAGEDIQVKLKDLTTIFDGNSFTRDKQIVKDTFINDYKPAAEELSYLLMNLVEKTETTDEADTTSTTGEITATQQTTDGTDETAETTEIAEAAIETDATAKDNGTADEINGTAAIQADGTDETDESNGTVAIQANVDTTPIPPGPPAPPAPITADKKTQITNSCAKLIEAHNKFSDILNQKRRY